MTPAVVTAAAIDATPFAAAMLHTVGLRVVDPATHRLVLALLRSAWITRGAP